MRLEPNVFIQSAKAVACAIVPGRRPRDAALVEFVHEIRERAGITTMTGQRRVTFERDPETMEVTEPPVLSVPESHTGERQGCFQRETWSMRRARVTEH